MDVLDRFFGAHRDAALAEGLFGDDYRAKVNGHLEDATTTLASMAAVRDAFPDCAFETVGRLERGDDVAVTWRMTGTHTGSYHGAPPTGRRVAVEGTTRFTLKEGRIHRMASRWDAEGLRRQLA